MGNQCFQSCFRIMKGILEHPAASKAWFLSPIVSWRDQPGVHLVTAGFCQLPTPWRRRTCFSTSRASLDDPRRLSLRRVDAHCPKIGHRHLPLAGHTIVGVSWTQVSSEHYPIQLSLYISSQPLPYPPWLPSALGSFGKLWEEDS